MASNQCTLVFTKQHSKLPIIVHNEKIIDVLSPTIHCFIHFDRRGIEKNFTLALCMIQIKFKINLFSQPKWKVHLLFFTSVLLDCPYSLKAIYFILVNNINNTVIIVSIA